jgi:hypothetical protein
MTTTNEIWTSKEPQLPVLTISYNPASGTQTTRIANLSASEPDPALFMVPDGYSIVDEEKSFTITLGREAGRSVSAPPLRTSASRRS